MNKIYILLLVIMLVAGTVASWVINLANESHDIPTIKKVPNFSLINQNGDPFTEKDLINKITVLDFFFTNCPGPCPIMTHNMKNLYNDFSSTDAVQFVSITVDPENDSYEILKTYSKINGVEDQRWQFLTSDLSSIKVLKQGGFMLFADELPQGHAIKFILIDEKGNIRKYFDGTDDASIAILKKDITQLVRQIRSI